MSFDSYSITARWILPVSGPPVESGVLNVRNGVIRNLVKDPQQKVDFDLGESILMPMLVNAHTHLEFCDLPAPIGQRATAITEWIPQVVRNRVLKRPADKQAAIESGIERSLVCGTGALGDIATGNEFVRDAGGIETTTFLECLGNDPKRVESVLSHAEAFLKKPPPTGRIGLSPHAPYSVHPDLLDGTIRLARHYDVPVAMHLAESTEELEFLQHGTGPFRELLDRLGAYRDPCSETLRCPLDYLVELSKCSSSLIVHGNYLDDESLEFVARHRKTMHIVFCPRSHDFFGHRPYRLQAMLDRGINVALGTDSLASNPDLSVWRELTHVHQTHPELSNEMILRMGTDHGARALGCDERLGSLTPGRQARLLVLALSEQVYDPYEVLFDGGVEPTQWVATGK